MNVNMKSQRAFAAVTLMTVFSIAMVLVVYAALLGTINSTGYVNVGGVGGEVYYSITPSETTTDWTNNLNITSTGTAWYAKMNTTSGGYIGLASFSWQLQKSTTGGSSWSDVGTATMFDFSMTGGYQTIYATDDGLSSGTWTNWAATTGYTTGMWRVEVTINSKA